eukprot:NODE_24308_length_630_cov_3.045726.p2 GENE.NODE_24308_length_630_cov_3.045726~~NODE_24308_length_630_cov_3.045726.p2  ORF type:complete len:83 (+),score=9.25 NODE_24308_length_630_cov_3.045726:234-482(+)
MPVPAETRSTPPLRVGGLKSLFGAWRPRSPPIGSVVGAVRNPIACFLNQSIKGVHFASGLHRSDEKKKKKKKKKVICVDPRT